MRLVSCALLSSLLLVACGGGSGSSDLSPPSSKTNSSPVFVLSPSYTVFEGEAFVLALDATDPDGSNLTYSITGNDSAAFNLSGQSLSLSNLIDFETPEDANLDNRFDITVTVSDGVNSVVQSTSVEILNAYEGRVVDGPVASALVFFDLNGNFVKDTNEQAYLTDDNGYFRVTQTITGDLSLVAAGGRDSITQKDLFNTFLASPISLSTENAFANLTPLSTLVALTSRQAVQTLLANQGEIDLDNALNTDIWDTVDSSPESSDIQLLNFQTIALIYAVDALSAENYNEAIKSIATGLGSDEHSHLFADFTRAETVQAFLVSVFQQTAVSLGLDDAIINAVGESLAATNQVMQSNKQFIKSESFRHLIVAIQQDIPNKISALVAGDISTQEYLDEVIGVISLDRDNDGVIDSEDQFPDDPNESVDTDNDGIGNNADTDDDGDGVPDATDAFPLNPRESIDTDGDGIGNNEDSDDDNDGVLDSEDHFPLDPNESVDTDGDGIGNNADTDDDGDGVPDVDDPFPLDPGELLDTDNDGIGNNTDPDDDNDGVLDTDDAFPLDPNESIDTDNDGIGNNADTDDDGDGYLDSVDAFPLDPTESTDTDNDGLGDNADLDDDGDNVPDANDRFPFDPNESSDTDNDGIGNNADTDDDGDGVLDADDAFPLDRDESLDTDNDGIGNNADTDDDGDGVLDVNDAAPLDRNVTFIQSARDLDADGVPDANDPDIDNDGFNNDVDAFPRDPNEWLDTDNDNIGNNADNDDDGDGVADADDELPLDPNNILDNDNDGVVNILDVEPNNSAVTKALRFNFSEVENVGISESVKVVDTADNQFINQLTVSPFNAASLFNPMSLSSGQSSRNRPIQQVLVALEQTTNVNSVDAQGNPVGDAILASEAFFVAETVPTPDGKFTYLLTSPRIQESLQQQNLPPEICHLYVVTLEDDTFRCVLDTQQPAPEPVQLITNSRIWFTLKGLQFRADNTAVFTSNNKVYLLSKDLSVIELTNDSPEGNYLANTSGFGWLDDQHVFSVVGYVERDDDGKFGNYLGPRIIAINIETLEVVARGTENDILENSAGQVSQLGDLIYVGGRAVRWTGELFESAPEEEGRSIQTIVDPFTRGWFYEDNYEGTTPKLLSSKDSNHRIRLTDEARNAFDDEPSSGTGSGVVYKNFAFTKDYVLHAYGMNAPTPVQTIEQSAYRSSTIYTLPNSQGYVLVDNRFAIWDYLPTADTRGDVTINYEASVDGALEARSMVVPAIAIERYLAEYPSPINPLDYANDIRQVTDGDTIRLYTPEPDRLGFCVYELATTNQQCAKLSNFDSSAIRLDYIQGSKYLPSDYYECVDNNCTTGIQNLVLIGDDIYAYFRDHTDGQFYAASANINTFMLQGEDTLLFQAVTHTSGESEIMASANKISTKVTDVLNAVSASYTQQSVILSFAQGLNQYASLPELQVRNSAGVIIPQARAVKWSDTKDKATIYLSSVGFAINDTLTVSSNDGVFLANSIERLAFPEEVTVSVSASSSFVLDDGSESVIIDFSPVTNNNLELLSSLSIAGDTVTIDLTEQPLNGLNIANLLAGDASAQVPEASVPIRVLPVGNNSANVTIKLYTGDDQIRVTGERYAELSFSVDWQADGVSALFTVPEQTVSGQYITGSGTVVELSIANFAEDVIGISNAGVNYPTSLDVRFMQVLNKINGILPTNILVSGEYVAVVSTDIPLSDQDGVVLTELLVKFTIGEN